MSDLPTSPDAVDPMEDAEMNRDETAAASDPFTVDAPDDCRNDLQHGSSDDVSTRDDANTAPTEAAPAPGLPQSDETAERGDVPEVDDTGAMRRMCSENDNAPSPHSDAISDTRTYPAEEDERQDGARRTTSGPARGRANGPESLQDRRALHRIVDLKYLSTKQLHDAVFRGTDISLVRRWMRRLEANGWVTLWTPRTRSGSAPQYAFPTAKALRWALAEKLRAAAGTDVERLAQLTIPTVDRRPVRRNAEGYPAFFAHQRGVADMLIAFDRPTVDTLWSTAWDRPLPKTIGTFTPPQPDGIIVVRHRDGRRHLLFIEHDRGTEKAKDFARAKRGYARMTLTPNLVRRTFGVDAFEVLVTVETPRSQDRIKGLQIATAAAHYPRWLFCWYDAARIAATSKRGA